MPRVVRVKVVRLYELELVFADGKKKRIDVEPLLWGHMFEPLRDSSRFREIKVDPELGTVVWPNSADISPEFLYDAEEVEQHA